MGKLIEGGEKFRKGIYFGIKIRGDTIQERKLFKGEYYLR
jgi:hypothetical protein